MNDKSNGKPRMNGAAFLAATVLLLAAGCVCGKETALDRYIKLPDASFRYSLVGTTSRDCLTIQTLELTSQSWRSASEVNRTEWKHRLTIIRPAKVNYSTAFLFITGGANNGRPPALPDAVLRKLAEATGSIVVELRMVPNQPLVFAGESQARSEDDFIVYTWEKFLRGGDEQWPARLPMTKSVVRAMDAVQQFCAGETGGRLRVENFVVSGASKRGWTTWTTAAVDKRVAAIVPLVIDVLNLEKFYDHQYRAFGAWPPGDPYDGIHIHDWAGTERLRQLLAIEDPYAYRARLTQPKFILNAAGDQCFPPDSSQFYWNDLKGPKYLRYVPNANHSLRGTDAMETVAGFYQAFLRRDEMPKYSWTFEKDGTIKVKAEPAPREVKVWAATNPVARDFRLDSIGPAYKQFPAREESPGVYIGSIKPPAKGWTAFFVEMTWDMPGGTPIKMTTGVRVLPDILPSAAYVKQPIHDTAPIQSLSR